MTALQIEEYLKSHFPLARALNIQVLEAEPSRVEIVAPLAANQNHMQTAFGGSLSAILILACYGWAFRALRVEGLRGHVILKRSEIDFVKPLKSDIFATCESPAAQELRRFLDQLGRKGKSRIQLTSYVSSPSGEHCRLHGEFVAVLDHEPRI